MKLRWKITILCGLLLALLVLALHLRVPPVLCGLGGNKAVTPFCKIRAIMKTQKEARIWQKTDS